MNIAMTHRETSLLEAFLRASQYYLEFGSGGSTVLAAQFVKERVISVDSSAEWLDSVKSHVCSLQTTAKVVLHHVDLGATIQWGYPANHTRRENWPNYSTSVWVEDGADKSDLYLIDGRFRVSCFAEAIIRSSLGSIIMIHDFENRPHYHVLKGLARCVARVENLSAFVKDHTTNVCDATKLAERYRLDAQ